MNAVWDAWVAPGNTPVRACVETKLAAPAIHGRDHGDRGARLRRPRDARADHGRRRRRRHRRLATARGRPRGHAWSTARPRRPPRPALPTPAWWRPATPSPGLRPRPPKILLKSLIYKDQPLRFRCGPSPRSGAGRCSSWPSARASGPGATRASSTGSAATPAGAAGGRRPDRASPTTASAGACSTCTARRRPSIAAPPTCRSCARPGRSSRWSTATRAVALEPALAPARKDRGRDLQPSDESGDACKFARALAESCAERGGELPLSARR